MILSFGNFKMLNRFRTWYHMKLRKRTFLMVSTYEYLSFYKGMEVEIGYINAIVITKFDQTVVVERCDPMRFDDAIKYVGGEK